MQLRLRPQSRRRQFGQGMTEYIIIVALIAIAAIGVYNYFGSTVRNQTGAIAAALGGDEGAAKGANANGKAAGGNASSEAGNKKSLANFTDGVAAGAGK